MIGKCQRQDFPSARTTRTKHPLEQVNWDLMMVNEISIEGYRYAMILTDSFTGYIWVYGIKTKDQTLGTLKKWYCDIAPLRANNKLINDYSHAGQRRREQVSGHRGFYPVHSRSESVPCTIWAVARWSARDSYLNADKTDPINEKFETRVRCSFFTFVVVLAKNYNVIYI